jgi:hypothetical protein
MRVRGERPTAHAEVVGKGYGGSSHAQRVEVDALNGKAAARAQIAAGPSPM